LSISDSVMPSRIVYRKGKSKRSSTSVVPGGQTKRVNKGASRNAAIYAYQPPRIALRKLIHLLGGNGQLKVNSGNIVFPSSNSSMVSLNSCVQGDGLFARHANKIYMKDLLLSWGHGGTVSSSVPFTYGCIVVYDRESRGSAPLINDILINSDPIAQQNPVPRDRYDILYRKTYTCAPEYCWNGAQMFPQIGISWGKTFAEKISIERMTTYSASISNDYLEILKGGLWVYFFGPSAPGASNPNIYFTYQLTFIDVE